jgi:hypothetical protein
MGNVGQKGMQPVEHVLIPRQRLDGGDCRNGFNHRADVGWFRHFPSSFYVASRGYNFAPMKTKTAVVKRMIA